MRTALFWVITQRVNGRFHTDVSGLSIGNIFMGQDETDRLSAKRRQETDHYPLRNDSEERGSRLHAGGRLKSCEQPG